MSKLPGRSTATQRQDVNLPSYHYPFFQPSEHAKLPTVKTLVISRVNTGKTLMLAKINTNGTTTAKSEKKVCLLSLPQSQLFVFKQTRFTKTKSEHREHSEHCLEYCLYEERIISAFAFRPYVTNFGCTCTVSATTNLHLASREGNQNCKTSGSKNPSPSVVFSNAVV